MSRSPEAPALAQSFASSFIFATRLLTDGWELSKTHSLQCFQIIHGVSKAKGVRPLRMGFEVRCLPACHQSRRDASWFGGVQDMRSQASISCQSCLENGQQRSRWRIDSGL